MKQIEMLIDEMRNEAKTTRKMLSRVPMDKPTWKPHEKSMAQGALAVHIAELPEWVTMALTTDELDFAANPYKQAQVTSQEDLLNRLDAALASGLASLQKATPEQLQENWTLRTGNTIHSVSTKAEVIRMAYCQIVHHRAQLGVYLRLQDIPIPGSYGPSADDLSF